MEDDVVEETEIPSTIREVADDIYGSRNEWLKENNLPLIDYQDAFKSEEDKNITSLSPFSISEDKIFATKEELLKSL